MKKIKELINYGIVGGITTAINYVIFIAILKFNGDSVIIANSLAWVGAVLFAYVANRKYVFKSNGNRINEITKFFTLRLITLLIENILLVLLIDKLGMMTLIAKILVSVITVIGNYVFCKYSIFKETKSVESKKSSNPVMVKGVKYYGQN